MLQWYQRLFLNLVPKHLAKQRIQFVKNNLPEGGTFLGCCDRAVNNTNAWPDPHAMEQLKVAIGKLKVEYFTESQKDPGEHLDKKFQFKFGYLIIEHVGRDGLKTLLSE